MINNKKNLISGMLVVVLTMSLFLGIDFSSEHETKVDAASAGAAKVKTVHGSIIKKLGKSKKVIKIKFINGGVNDEYDGSKRTIYWDYRDGGVFKYKKVVTSAALALAHEMGYAAQHLDGQINKKVPKVEKANLKKYETPIAGQLGEPIRSYYKEISGTRKMNNSTHYITSHQHPYKPWKSYICHHNQWPVVGTTIGPAK